MRSGRLMMIERTQKLEDCNNSIIQVDPEDDTPHFFKFIVSPLHQKKQLRIPAEFVKKHGIHISDDIWLNVPKSKQTWKVMLEKDSNDNLFLGKGWQAFMEFYNLEFGHLLVFKLNNGSQTYFRVLIFDKTGAEIDYLVGGSSEARRITNSARLSVDNYITEDGDVIIETSDDNSPKSLKCNKTTENIVDLQTSDSDDAECSSYQKPGYVITRETKKIMLRKLDDEYKSSYPHFKAIMSPSYVHDRYRMNVTFGHAAEHFPSKSKEIILLGPNGKKYHVTFYIGKKHAQLQSGWRNFVLDNLLKIGDACLFELIDTRSHSYRVTILRR